MIKRLVNIVKSPKTQLESEGYARYYKVERPFRHRNPYNSETLRQISESNDSMGDRLRSIKPFIGSTGQWSK